MRFPATYESGELRLAPSSNISLLAQMHAAKLLEKVVQNQHFTWRTLYLVRIIVVFIGNEQCRSCTSRPRI